MLPYMLLMEKKESPDIKPDFVLHFYKGLSESGEACPCLRKYEM
jgi:hypothetical protein